MKITLEMGDQSTIKTGFSTQLAMGLGKQIEVKKPKKVRAESAGMTLIPNLKPNMVRN